MVVISIVIMISINYVHVGVLKILSFLCSSNSF